MNLGRAISNFVVLRNDGVSAAPAALHKLLGRRASSHHFTLTPTGGCIARATAVTMTGLTWMPSDGLDVPVSVKQSLAKCK